MQLGNIFSDAQISALKSMASAPAGTKKHTSCVSEKAWETLYDLAVRLGQKLLPKFWEALNTSIQANQEVVVCMRGKKEALIEPVIRQVCFAKHLGMMLKSGYSIVWIGKGTTVVTWDNWKSVYNALTTPPCTREYDEPMSETEYRSIKTARQRERGFYDLAKSIRTKKGGRCRISFEEARAQRIKSEQIVYEYSVEARARKILEAL